MSDTDRDALAKAAMQCDLSAVLKEYLPGASMAPGLPQLLSAKAAAKKREPAFDRVQRMAERARQAAESLDFDAAESALVEWREALYALRGR